ncbi:Lethal(2) giant larvae protein 1 [Phytophthora pseudosyringae]|uniref:Lethal(2) giant larvae protein 1 n=1 Tax=Phytophthora pseudosyringae TaxID=221518 RepID=A0A8T1VST5_9STRA|nr:Lethal(2) giant larvae protein 1 [Phytophthora pseudosyringae]
MHVPYVSTLPELPPNVEAPQVAKRMGNKASRSTSAAQLALDALLARPSALQSAMFALHATAHHGVPSDAQALALCGLQGLLAVGTASGAVKLFGADGLEVLLAGPEAASHVAVGVTHLQFTARQRLVVGYSDSSLRVFELASGAAALLCCVSDAWTASVLTSLETVRCSNFPFFFVATDDGDIHVVHEETGRVSTYVVRPQDVSEPPGVEGVTAMAAHPRDANLLLVAYDTCPAVLLWDVARRKVVREFALAGKAHKLLTTPSESFSSAEDGEQALNSPQTLSWHSSGKRFVAGYKHGGFAVFRADKARGLYRCVAPSDQQTTAVKQIKWVCAPPTSKHAALPGAIVFSGGRNDPSGASLLTVVHPPTDGRSSDDTLTDLFKADKLTWLVSTIESANHAEIAAFEAAQDQVDVCVKVAPLSLILLSGNPLDGCLPAVSVQCLPCFVKLTEGDKEEWEWRMDRLPEPAVIPPLLQLSPLKTFALVNLSHSDSTLQDDLLSTWNQEKYDPRFRLAESGDFEWPINGGSVLEPMLKGFLATSGALDGGAAGIAPNSMMLLTGHANGCVLFWEAQTAGDRSSKGAIRLLHVVDAPLQMSPAPVNPEITCLAFCSDSRTLVVGFASGEIVILEFDQLKPREECLPTDGAQQSRDSEVAKSACDQEQKPTSEDQEHDSSTAQTAQGTSQKDTVGFRTLFSIHVHTEPISKLAMSSSYGYVAIADAAGMVSLVEIKTQNFQLLVCDISPTGDESMSVDSLLMSELVQTTEIPGSGSSPPSLPGNNRNSGKGSPGKASIYGAETNCQNMIQHREVIPVLFVGRGSGKLEMYHVQSATKMGETLVDPEKATSLSSIIMVDGDGKRIEIPGRKWGEQVKELNVAGGGVDSAAAAVSSDMVEPKLAETPQKGDVSDVITDQRTQRTGMPNADFERTQQFVMEAKNERSKTATTEVPAQAVEPPSWAQSNLVEVSVPPGSLGLHLFMEVEQHAVVKGFAGDGSTAALLAARGVCLGHTLTVINGVDVTSLDRDLVCSVLKKLRERENLLVFAEGFKEVPAINETGVSDSLAVDTRNVTDIERPRFLVCTCGKAIHVVQATVPRAAEMAMGPKEIPAQPLASIELQGAVLVTSIVRVPVGEGVENCLAVIDLSNRVYILSLLSLKPIWEAECNNFGFGLGCSGLVDGILSDISYGGELVVANSFGEMERFSLFAEATAMESAMLERSSIKTRLHLPERVGIFDQATSPSSTDSGKKRGIAADAGKMFKKLVLSVTQEATDLNKVFQFSTEADERKRLMGDRSSPAKDAVASDSATAKTETGLNATKDALMQAQQRLAERGDKLNDLGLKTEQMKKTSEDFYQTMKAFNEKNANKKWYEM